MVCNYATLKGFGQTKLTCGDGSPDRLFYRGHFCFFIEFKTPKGVLSERQKIKIRRMSDHTDADISIVRSIKEGKALIDYKVKQFEAIHRLLK